jgi:hypothetical protein
MHWVCQMAGDCNAAIMYVCLHAKLQLLLLLLFVMV